MYKMLKKYKPYLTKQQYKTIKGQIITGDYVGAEKGLKKLATRNRERKMERIIKKINEMSGQYHSHNIFQDWVQMMAISISNQVDYDDGLEETYKSIAKKYTQEQLIKLCEMNGILVELFQNGISDYLGEIYMKLNAGNTRTGQFFTPFHICELMAEIQMKEYDGKEIVMNEPSCGGSANILAIAKVMKNKGFNYQELLKVIAQDLDYKCV